MADTTQHGTAGGMYGKNIALSPALQEYIRQESPPTERDPACLRDSSRAWHAWVRDARWVDAYRVEDARVADGNPRAVMLRFGIHEELFRTLGMMDLDEMGFVLTISRDRYEKLQTEGWPPAGTVLPLVVPDESTAVAMAEQIALEEQVDTSHFVREIVPSETLWVIIYVVKEAFEGSDLYTRPGSYYQFSVIISKATGEHRVAWRGGDTK